MVIQINWEKVERLEKAAEQAKAAGDEQGFKEYSAGWAIEMGARSDDRIAELVDWKFTPQTPEERAAAIKWWRDREMTLSYAEFYEERYYDRLAAQAFAVNDAPLKSEESDL